MIRLTLPKSSAIPIKGGASGSPLGPLTDAASADTFAAIMSPLPCPVDAPSGVSPGANEPRAAAQPSLVAAIGADVVLCGVAALTNDPGQPTPSHAAPVLPSAGALQLSPGPQSQPFQFHDATDPSEVPVDSLARVRTADPAAFAHEASPPRNRKPAPNAESFASPAAPPISALPPEPGPSALTIALPACSPPAIAATMIPAPIAETGNALQHRAPGDAPASAAAGLAPLNPVPVSAPVLQTAATPMLDPLRRMAGQSQSTTTIPPVRTSPEYRSQRKAVSAAGVDFAVNPPAAPEQSATRRDDTSPSEAGSL